MLIFAQPSQVNILLKETNTYKIIGDGKNKDIVYYT